MWLVTCDMWHLTPDTWHVTPDTFGGVKILSKFQLPSCSCLWIMILWSSGGKGSLNQSMNDEAVYRTAQATPCLLIKWVMFLGIWTMFFLACSKNKLIGNPIFLLRCREHCFAPLMIRCWSTSHAPYECLGQIAVQTRKQVILNVDKFCLTSNSILGWRQTA